MRMDICAFFGVAPRGPAREPVMDPSSRECRPDPRADRKYRRTMPTVIESFDEYREHFGGFEGPGLLPYAVASFFEQGGLRAYVCRIVHDYAGPKNDERVALGAVGGASATTGPVGLRARSEGAWGNDLRATLDFQTKPVSIRFEPGHPGSIFVDGGQEVCAGTLLRFRYPGNTTALRFVTLFFERRRDDRPEADWEAVLESPLPGEPGGAEILEGHFAVDDGDGRSETFDHQGLSSQHPRWLAATLYYESSLLFPDFSWVESDIKPSGANAIPFSGGKDAFDEIEPEDFFDAGWVTGDEEPGDGIAALAPIDEISLVVAPDLYSPEPLAPMERVGDTKSLAGPAFETCVENRVQPTPQTGPPPGLDGLRLDPRTNLRQIVALQKRLVDFAMERQSFIVLLDVPPFLTLRQILKWRTTFDTSYAAAYHPWLLVARRDDDRDVLVRIPPSAPAAGIVARRENQNGLSFGPANALAAEVVNARELVPGPAHDELHQEGVNVFLKERGGIRLMGARTLSREAVWRQLSVRRLVTMIRRALERQMQWAVFEPNGESLQSEMRHMLTAFMRELFRGGAFRGATEEEGFFVKCDRELNDRQTLDAGRFIAHVGVAPAEPLEFIVLRLAREGDGTLLVRE
jgi:hypothetical protein